ncbi:DNA primase [mine drainage metagenome]|uniref:DNA primase n=1 Tax=mine drainage metagenome TaxID=410659 RepID=T1B9T5_9ZZZZ
MNAANENARRQPGVTFETAREGTRSAHDTAPPRIGIDALLARLERVKQTASGWRADCANGHKTHGTLSITQANSGAILLHCFSGCTVADVLGGLGLTMADIQPQRLRDESPEARRQARERFRLASVSAAAGVIAREADLVLIAAADTAQGIPLTEADLGRLAEGVERLQAAREVLA